MISQEALSDFKKIYLTEYNIPLTNKQALDFGNRLISLVKAVYGNQLPDLKTIDKVKRQIQN